MTSLPETTSANANIPIKRSPPTGITVLIVGAGVAGLMSALECWREGHEVLGVFERSADVLLSGDIFGIGPSVTRNFRHWPYLATSLQTVQYDAWLAYYSYSGTHIFGPNPHEFNKPGAFDDSDDDKLKKGPYTAFLQSRPKFYLMLLHQVQELGIPITFNRSVEDYYEDVTRGVGGIVFADGEKMEADVVLAADGVGSKAWKIVGGGEKVKATSCGYAIYRTAYPVKLALEDPLVRERWGGGLRGSEGEGGRPIFEFWVGPDLHVVVVLTHDLASWSLTHKDDGTAKESWAGLTSPDTVLSLLTSHTATTGALWHPALKALINTTPPSSIIDWKLLWRDPQPEWTSPGGHVLQVGDSAHSFLPTSGNGATQAMEDAISIAACLQIGGRSNVAWATRVHNKLRFHRVSLAQKQGIINLAAAHHTEWNTIDTDPSAVAAKLGSWIWKHDPEGYAYEKYGLAFRSLVDGDEEFENTNVPKGCVYEPWTVGELLRAMERGEKLLLGGGDWS
ncbi:hypothetical protein G7Y89_g15676 [Cudoniella acicularis]|uniref:FAD-binding domain-containing protein n=1 Tax=Cudoniella acicularis TaxID=354080 RepID=A0A8H4VIW7_9HELO|nr:hypothetical protein G7Y89_g15676 [Cudoniella acicularis]